MDDQAYEPEAILSAWHPLNGQDSVLSPPEDLMRQLDGDIEAAGGPLEVDLDTLGAVGMTMFDLPTSEDNSVTILLPKDNLQLTPSQALVRINSRDERSYIGSVSRGPFAEPDSLRGDSPMLVTVATRGGLLLPPYHGRIQVSVLGEDKDGEIVPPLFRPLPNSPVFVLDEEQAAAILGTEGAIRLGLAVSYQSLEVRVPADRKDILPRHLAVLGTTGAGKSTTIAGFIAQEQAAGMATIILDVEGEYTYLNEPTEDPTMIRALEERGLSAHGIPADQMKLYHLVGRETANPDHPNAAAFSLQFARLSPYTVIEILGLNEAQAGRFLKAYDLAKMMMRDLGIFPAKGKPDQERFALEIDEFERGYPRLTLSFMLDMVRACFAHVDKSEFDPFEPALKSEEGRKKLQERLHALEVPKSPISWLALLGKLQRLNRLKVFDMPSNQAQPLNYAKMLQPGVVTVIDLSDSSMSELSNIVIADILRGVQEAQDAAYEAYEQAKKKGTEGTPPTRVSLIIEEAHEFLSAERIEQMPILFQQVARIAKRGRKRWLGLVFVTQLPQHLPRQVFGLVNSYLLHKITDPQVVTTLQRTVSGMDDSLWKRLPGLAPGQAIASFPHMTLPLLTSMDPTPAKLRLVD